MVVAYRVPAREPYTVLTAMVSNGLFALSLDRSRVCPELGLVLALSADDCLMLLRRAAAADAEAVIVCTKDRLEVYSTRFHVEAFRVVLAELARRGRGVTGFGALPVVQTSGGAAARQLFRQCTGVGSALSNGFGGLSEAGRALELAADAGTLGQGLEALFRSAMNAAWRARSETQFRRSFGDLSCDDVESLAVERILEEELFALRAASVQKPGQSMIPYEPAEPSSTVRLRIPASPPAARTARGA